MTTTHSSSPRHASTACRSSTSPSSARSSDARHRVELTETAHYSGIGRAHNLGINEDTGYAYVVGAREGLHGCAGGLHMVDVRQPASPTFAGCVAEDGYVHDTQCVVGAQLSRPS